MWLATISRRCSHIETDGGIDKLFGTKRFELVVQYRMYDLYALVVTCNGPTVPTMDIAVTLLTHIVKQL